MLTTKEMEQWVMSELENTELREKLDTLEKTAKVEENEKPLSRSLKLNFILGKTFAMTIEGSKVMSFIPVQGHQVKTNLSVDRLRV